ncbi:MAG: restriction endonuclease subunit S [Methanosarcina mazei]|nr:restriction endonuclease subunit S [Methanosarcina mazei]
MENKLPEGWEWKKLGDLIDLKYGKGLKKENRNLSGKFPVYGSNGIVDYHDDAIVSEPCLIVGRKGSIGAVHLSKTPCWPIDTTYYVLPPSEVGLTFLFYLLSTLNLENLNKSTAIPGLNRNDVYSKLVPLPPLETQQKIVSILEKAGETKKLRAQVDELTQKLLQSVFLEMFGDPVTNPMGWNTEKLEKLCVKIYGGGTPSKSKPEYYEGDIPWVTPKDMKQDFIQDSIDHISEKAIEESSTKLIPPYSLLMVIRSGILKHTLPIAINICKVTMNQDMKGFVFDNKLTNSFFMLYYFKIYQRDLLSRVRSVTADNLEFSQIKDIDVILPPIKQQQRFTTIVEQLERTRSNQEQSSFEINNLFDALMQKAFMGELVT